VTKRYLFLPITSYVILRFISRSWTTIRRRILFLIHQTSIHRVIITPSAFGTHYASTLFASISRIFFRGMIFCFRNVPPPTNCLLTKALLHTTPFLVPQQCFPSNLLPLLAQVPSSNVSQSHLFGSLHGFVGVSVSRHTPCLPSFSLA
jgi:hypothetical protein